MATNKTEVVAWIWSYRGRHMVTADYSHALELAEPPYPADVEPLIHLSDYEALQAECEKLRKDAELYRGLRAMHWHDSPLAVVRNPKKAVRPGYDCPSEERLDEAIDDAMQGASQ